MAESMALVQTLGAKWQSLMVTPCQVFKRSSLQLRLGVLDAVGTILQYGQMTLSGLQVTTNMVSWGVIIQVHFHVTSLKSSQMHKSAKCFANQSRLLLSLKDQARIKYSPGDGMSMAIQALVTEQTDMLQLRQTYKITQEFLLAVLISLLLLDCNL